MVKMQIRANSLLALFVTIALESAPLALAQESNQCLNDCNSRYGTTGSCLKACPPMPAANQPAAKTNPAVDCALKCLQSYSPCANECIENELENGETPTPKQENELIEEQQAVQDKEKQLTK